PHERKRTLDLLAAQQEAELALLQRFAHTPFGFIALVEPGAAFIRAVNPAIPDDHLSRAILSRGNRTFEGGVIERMVLGLRGEALFARIERRPLGHGPGLEDAVALEPQVIVHPARGMLLEDEQQRPLARRERRGRRLRGRIEAAL